MSGSIQPFRQCLNIKSKKHKDIQCKSVVSHGDFCARHYKKPIRYYSVSFRKYLETVTYPHNAIAAATKIQRWAHKILARLHYKQQGPSANCLEVSNNQTELQSMDPIQTIPQLYIWSYADANKMIWTFDIRSFSHMAASGFKNPYTQIQLTEPARNSLERRLIWLKRKGYTTIFTNDTELTAEQTFNLRILDVFMKMDFLGYHSNTEWFSELTQEAHIKLYTELYNLWNYRLQLTSELKKTICPGLETIMKHDPLKFSPRMQRELRWWQKLNINIFDTLVSTAAEKTNRSLGAMYCLTALCKVSLKTRIAYDWLDII